MLHIRLSYGVIWDRMTSKTYFEPPQKKCTERGSNQHVLLSSSAIVVALAELCWLLHHSEAYATI